MYFDDQAIADEGWAVTRSNGYRVKRPKKRPRKSRGHGLSLLHKDKFRASKRKVKPQIFVKPVAVKPVAVPGFLAKLLLTRKESRSQLTAEQYEVIRHKGN